MVFFRQIVAFDATAQKLITDLTAAINGQTAAVSRQTEAINRLNDNLEALQRPPETQWEIRFMTPIKDDAKAFYKDVDIVAKDSEGHKITDPKITLTVESDNTSAIEATLDPNGRRIHYTVGGPNDDGSPAIANVSVTATGEDGSVLAVGVDSYTVTTGDAKVAEITFGPSVEEAPAEPPTGGTGDSGTGEATPETPIQ